jgi:hypothetical protein
MNKYVIWKNKNIELWEIVKNISREDWGWEFLSNNPNITWDIIRDNPDKPWD